MKCETIQELLTPYLLGDLDAEQATQIRAHLQTCEHCRAAVREIEPTLDLLRDALAAPTAAAKQLSATHRNKVRQMLFARMREMEHVRRGRLGNVLYRLGLWSIQWHPGFNRAAAAVLVIGFVMASIMVPMFLPIFKMGEVVGGGAASEVTVLAPETIEEVEMLEESARHELTLEKREDLTGQRFGFKVKAPSRRGQMKEAVTGPFKTGEAVEEDVSGDLMAAKPEATDRWGAEHSATPAALPESVEMDFAPVTPAAFDTVAMVKSPVVMNGGYASRSPSRRDSSVARDSAEDWGSEDDVQVEVSDASGQADAPQPPYPQKGGAAASPPVSDSDARGLGYEANKREAFDYKKDAEQYGIQAPVATRSSPPSPPPPKRSPVMMSKRGVSLDASELIADAPAATAMPEESEEKAQLKARVFNVQPSVGDRIETTRSEIGADGYASAGKTISMRPRSQTKRILVEDPAGEIIKTEVVPGENGAPGRTIHVRMSEKVVDSVEIGGDKTDSLEKAAYLTFKSAKKDAAVEEEKRKRVRRDAEESARLEQERIRQAEEARAKAKERERKEEEAREEATKAQFKAPGVNPFVAAVDQPFSTFSIDVDTAAYTLARSYMMRGLLPPAEAVRTEEFVNFFDYAYKPPEKGVFGIYTEMAPSRFGRGMNLLKIGVKGRRLGREEQRTAVLTFVIDTSGSMNTPDRLELVKKSLRMLVDRLAPEDRVAIIQFGSRARLVLAHTPVSQKEKILAALQSLQATGSTNLEEAIRLAYETAGKAYLGGGVNRVLIVSDGAANLGSAAAEDILAEVDKFKKQGVLCSVFGFGVGTYNDVMLEKLANQGDGNYAFIDSEEEAERIFVQDLAATLQTIAADVKIQVEFNPAVIRQYRQLGYENRQLAKKDFRNDAVDAGEVGSGQAVTALYELDLAPVAMPMSSHVSRGKQRYPPTPIQVAVVRVRYRRTDNGRVEEIEQPVMLSDMIPDFESAPVRFRLAAAVAEFSEILRGSPHAAGSEFTDVAEVLRPLELELDLDRRVAELRRLVEGARGMSRAGK